MMGRANGGNKRGPGRPRSGLPPGSGLDMMAGPPGGPDVPTGGGKTKSAAGSTANKKRYTCEICQKRFSTAWYVRVHRKSHNGERPYICNNCGKGFMLPNVLQVHLRKCEKNNPNNRGPMGNQQSQSGRSPTQMSPSVPPPPPGGSVPPMHQGGPYGDQSPMGGPPGMGPGLTNYGQRFPGYGAFPGEPPMSAPHPERSPPMGHYRQESPFSMLPGQGAGMVPTSSAPPSSEQDNSGSGIPTTPVSSNASPYPGGGGMYSPQDIQIRPPSGPGGEEPSPPSVPTPGSNHFLGHDRPPDEGGGSQSSPLATEKAVPPGVNPDLYCITCELQFEDKSGLEEHQKSHRPYSCEVCEKRFSQKCNLITHMRLHTGERPYPCSYCDKRFTQKGNLDAHLKTHTKEKPYPCPHCDKRFAFKSSMLSHAKQAHGHLMGSGTMSPLSSGVSSGGLDLEEDDISSIKQQLRYAAAAAVTATPVDTSPANSSPPPNTFSTGIPTPQSSLDSLSGGSAANLAHAFNQPFGGHDPARAGDVVEEPIS